jgi:L-lactate utilization protein LutC
MKNRNNSQLISQFIQAAERSAATVERINHDAKDLRKALLESCGHQEVVLLAHPEDIDEELFTLYKKLPQVITNPTDQQLANTRIGITDAFAGVAHTGSICVSITPKLCGSISLFSREHIAILDAAKIVLHPRDIISEKYMGCNGLERSFTFITGPSATADMGPLVHGVHGPGRLHIIILE